MLGRLNAVLSATLLPGAGCLWRGKDDVSALVPASADFMLPSATSSSACRCCCQLVGCGRALLVREDVCNVHAVDDY